MILRAFTHLRQFARDTRGNASIEIAIFAPLLMFLLAASYVYYDAYRQKAINTNAAYTISDAFSRQTDAIDDVYMTGMHDLLEFLTHADTETGLRVTVVRWDATDGQYHPDWSESRGPLYPLTERDLNTALVDNLPTLLNNERVIVVETSSIYEPPYNIPGIASQELYNFAFTRPRFAPKLVWSNL
ncbi:MULTISPECIES: TadE/TadG family type IV pilus assembly protein [unclassified Marinovum]